MNKSPQQAPAEELGSASSFEQEVTILFAIPKAELDAAEATRLKRPALKRKPKNEKGAA